MNRPSPPKPPTLSAGPTEVTAPSEDAELLRRTANGDRSAFDAFVVRHAAAVLRLAQAIAPDAALAEDVVQQAFMAAFRSASTFRGEASPRSWLLTIARHAAYKVRSRQLKEQPVEEPLARLGGEAGWGAVDPEAMAIRAEQRDRLEAAIGRLSPSDREVLILRDIEQLSGAETAAMLGVQLRAMKSRLHRARLRLAVALREQSDMEGSSDE